MASASNPQSSNGSSRGPVPTIVTQPITAQQQSLSQQRPIRNFLSTAPAIFPVQQQPSSIMGIEMDPAEFLIKADLLSSTAPPIDISQPHSFLSSDVALDQTIASSFRSMESMTTAPTVDTAPMTQSSTNMSNMPIGGSEMLRICSRQSFHSLPQDNGVQAFMAPAVPDKRRSDASLLSYPTFSVASPISQRPPTTQLSQSVPAAMGFVPADTTPSSQGLGSAAMERSISSQSARSASSIQNSLARQNSNAARQRVIQPRPNQPDGTTYCDSNGAPPTAGAHSSSPPRPRTAITRVRPERPNRQKAVCSICPDKPTFRGDHELRRHTQVKHSVKLEKWMCIKPPADEMHLRAKPVIPLEKCKQCSTKKQYNKDYNAAAHLRRKHFNVRQGRRARGQAGDQPEEKRGGRGGGDQPPMSELKHWMKKVIVYLDQRAAELAQVDEDGDGDEESELFPGDWDSQPGVDGRAPASIAGEDALVLPTADAGGNGAQLDQIAVFGVGDVFSSQDWNPLAIDTNTGLYDLEHELGNAATAVLSTGQDIRAANSQNDMLSPPVSPVNGIAMSFASSPVTPAGVDAQPQCQPRLSPATPALTMSLSGASSPESTHLANGMGQQNPFMTTSTTTTAGTMGMTKSQLDGTSGFTDAFSTTQGATAMLPVMGSTNQRLGMLQGDLGDMDFELTFGDLNGN
ncbi:zinc finger domain-containing protein [Thermochaetoides thermophila DSM 1495]|uniref:Zinc finger domain-containing protein n=1 Tax=Chaetomium thermophilum (strain DSM 1495 / CBS 144.50 / IMI 039719) TaxID=759272 RepID=G0RYW5_CHATD|nr:zinc finger domain-containing protein [Thermochaetoides thermophila DSM 1495]EGS23393.1 zinc finger domain-containing protein [Thermochaetoides thermophila DSM 1495]